LPAFFPEGDLSAVPGVLRLRARAAARDLPHGQRSARAPGHSYARWRCSAPTRRPPSRSWTACGPS
jgi:hypothetical protein